MSPHTSDHRVIIAPLHQWFKRNGRALPWRVVPPDPYHIWLSEVMGQQTTLAAVIPYFQKFITQWPTLADLAAADPQDILSAWAGLGYYARARNLHRCAQIVMTQHGGHFPTTENALRQLPGLGDYAAAAIAAIAFGQPAVVVDGNVARVISRLYALKQPIPQNKPRIRDLASGITPTGSAGLHAEAMMDLGATVCTPRSPACGICPLGPSCRARALGIAEQLPTKASKAPRPDRFAVAFWLTRPDGAVLLRRRPTNGLLGGMLEFPSTPWQDGTPWIWDNARTYSPTSADWNLHSETIVHIFSHFRLILQVATAQTSSPPDGLWLAPDTLKEQALPSVMMKVARLAQSPPRATPPGPLPGAPDPPLTRK